MSDLPLILRSLWSVVPSEATGAAANFALVAEHAFPNLSRGEESLLAFLIGFGKQHGAVPGGTATKRKRRIVERPARALR